jgi:hypothetical protein
MPDTHAGARGLCMAVKEPVPGYVGIDTAAAILGVSRSKFRRLAAEINLEVRATPVDHRMKLVALDDVKKLRQRLPKGRTVIGNGATRK